MAELLEDRPPRRFKLKQNFPLTGIAYEAAYPTDRYEPCASRHGRNAVERVRGIEKHVAGIKFDSLTAARRLDDQFAAVILGCRTQEQRKGKIGPHAVHQRIIDVRAIDAVDAVAHHRWTKNELWLRRHLHDRMAENSKLDFLAKSIDCQRWRRLISRFAILARPSSTAAAIGKGGGGKHHACRVKLGEVNHIGNRELHDRWNSLGASDIYFDYSRSDLGSSRMLERQDRPVRTVKRQLWFGIGTAVLVASSGVPTQTAEPGSKSNSGALPVGPGRGGETYLSDGGPSDSRVRYIRDLTLLTGQILTADDLVAADLWSEARSHIQDQTAEHRERIQPYIRLHGALPLAVDLALTVEAIEARDVQAYTIARIALGERLKAARSIVQKFTIPHHRYALRGLVEALKAAAGAYETALDGTLVVSISEYREGRGYLKAIIAALDDIRSPLEQADAATLARIDAEIAKLALAWPALRPPVATTLSAVAVAEHVARIVALSSTY